MKAIFKFLQRIRRVLLVILGIGLPVFIYLAFIARAPVIDVEYDLSFGAAAAAEIAADTIEYPVLSREGNEDVYAYLDAMVEDVVASPAIQYREIFTYDNVLIIERDDILNAFCTPGGHIYVYTGLINYLDQPDHLAGVLGHEIAHAELRHSSLQLQQKFGREKLLTFIALYAAGSVSDVIGLSIINDLVGLNYSREMEAEADRASVEYLSTSNYACDGCAGFFQKLEADGSAPSIPEFLSDHPDGKARIREISDKAREIACSTDLSDAALWSAFKASIARISIPVSDSINN